jgi:hypothetical protein
MPLKQCDNLFNPLTGKLLSNTFLMLFFEGTSHIQEAVPPSARAQINLYHVSKGHFGYLFSCTGFIHAVTKWDVLLRHVWTNKHFKWANTPEQGTDVYWNFRIQFINHINADVNWRHLGRCNKTSSHTLPNRDRLTNFGFFVISTSLVFVLIGCVHTKHLRSDAVSRATVTNIKCG